MDWDSKKVEQKIIDDYNRYEQEKNYSNENWSNSKENSFTIRDLPNGTGIFRGQFNKVQSPLGIYTLNLKTDSVNRPVTFESAKIQSENDNVMCIICKYIINYPFTYYMYKKAPEKHYIFGNTLCINCMKLIYDKKYTPNTSTANFKGYSLKNRKNVSSKRKSSKRKSSKRKSSKIRSR